jgi:hypothetical protein
MRPCPASPHSSFYARQSQPCSRSATNSAPILFCIRFAATRWRASISSTPPREALRFDHGPSGDDGVAGGTRPTRNHASTGSVSAPAKGMPSSGQQTRSAAAPGRSTPISPLVRGTRLRRASRSRARRAHLSPLGLDEDGRRASRFEPRAIARPSPSMRIRRIRVRRRRRHLAARRSGARPCAIIMFELGQCATARRQRPAW